MSQAARAVLACLVAAPCAAQQWEVFDMAGAGFPSDHISALAQALDHSIWVGTDWGLVHGHDGGWTVHQQGSSGLPENAIRCLAFDDQQRLWAGTLNAGIGILDGDQWTVLNTTNSPLASDEVNHIAHDHLGRTWIATPAGLHLVQDGQWVLYNDTPESHLGHQLFGPHMLGTATRADGLVGVYTRNAGLVYLDGVDMVDYTSYNSTFPDNSGNGLVFDSAGDRWLASAATGLIWHFGPYTEPGWTTYGTNAGLPDNTMTCIAIGPGDRKYVGTEIGGLLLFDGPGQWSVLDQANSGLPDDHVRCLLLTDDGILWAGTNSGGLARLDAALGVNDPPPEAHFTVFPNPFTVRLHVRGTGGHAHGPLRWRMLDPLGATVRSGAATGPAWSVDAHGLADGMYLLEVRQASSVSYHRLTKD